MYNPQTLENIWIFSTFKRNHETTLLSISSVIPPKVRKLYTFCTQFHFKALIQENLGVLTANLRGAKASFSAHDCDTPETLFFNARLYSC